MRALHPPTRVAPRTLRAAVAARLTSRNLILLSGLLTLIVAYNFLSGYVHRRADVHVERPTPAELLEKAAVPCIGPRGKLIPESLDDQVQAVKLDMPYPQPFAGSFEELGLGADWTTADGRYGPYGYGDGANHRSAVDWERVDWGRLQMQCQEANADRFGDAFNASEVRLRLRDDSDDDWLDGVRGRLGFPKPAAFADQPTGKTALVLRTYDKYKYTGEDLINIRALISEAGLQSGGEYTVVLYVNVKDPEENVLTSPANYSRALDAIPEELRHLTVLWDDNLLTSWYPHVPAHGIMFQINQAFQLFALFYPEFDHYWQLELDIRSLGHTLTWLRALDRWSRDEPRKQSVERASYLYLPAAYESYAAFQSAVNASLDGGATIWGPLRIPEIPHPIGPTPPGPPQDDDFRWGVGEPADLVVTNPCSWVMRMHSWVFRGWYKGPFTDGDATPRMTCPPAIQRASRQLLLAVHGAQARLGLAVPSEATLPSWALWHGLKISFPPAPNFQRHSLSPRTAEVFFNGGRPGECVRLTSRPDDDAAVKELNADILRFIEGMGEDLEDGVVPEEIPWVDLEEQPLPLYKGFGCGEAFNNQLPRVELTRGMSWWWQSRYPRRIVDAWIGAMEKAEQPAADWPDAVREWRGEMFAPQGWLHPVKHG